MREVGTLGLGILLVVLTVVLEWHWSVVVLGTMLGLFMVVWGRHPSTVEARIEKLPAGKMLVSGLHRIASFVAPGDEELEAHLTKLIGSYDARTRDALKQYYVSGNHHLLPGDLSAKFYADGFLIAGTGNIKLELRDTVLKVLAALSS